jgi:hypothetical protein
MGNYSSPLVQNTLPVWHRLFYPLEVFGGTSFSLGEEMTKAKDCAGNVLDYSSQCDECRVLSWKRNRPAVKS